MAIAGIYSEFSVYEAGNNILFAKLQTFAPDLNVNEARRRGQGGNLIHGWFPKTMTMTMTMTKTMRERKTKTEVSQEVPLSQWSIWATGRWVLMVIVGNV